jgi:hypothetical protein
MGINDMNNDFRAYARQLSSQTIDERIVELQRSSVRDERNAPTYTQQIRILRDELQRRVRDYDQLEHRNRNMGTRPTTIT